MIRRLGRLAIATALAVVVAGCGAGATSPDPSASAGGGDVIELSFSPPGIEGCDAIGVDYRAVTFVIDPAADEDVTATTDTGRTLSTRWAPGFVGGPAAERIVLDPGGQVVARDGEQLVLPAAGWPSLHGYAVCPGPDQLTILSVRD